MSDAENIVQTPSTISTFNEDSTLFAEGKRKLSNLIGGIFKPLDNSNEARNLENSKITKEEKTLDIPTSKKEFDWHISISPDGKNILKFNHHELELEIIQIIPKNNLKEVLVSCKVGNEFNNEVNNNEVNKEVSKDNFPKWMIAISNSIKEKEVLVAISRVTRSDMISPPKDKSNKKNSDKNKFVKQSPVNETVQTGMIRLKEVIVEATDIFDKINTSDEKNTSGERNTSDEKNASGERNEVGKTVIYKIDLNSKSRQPICNDLPGGIVNFVHNNDNNNDNNDFHCFIFNASGICRKMFTHDLNHKKMEQFYYPRKLQNELYTLYRKKPCLTKLYNSIFDHNFFIEQYKEGIQVLQLYDLRTMELEQIFNLREEKSIKKFGTPIFARSVNERVVAFSTGFRKLFLFFVENGLLLATSEDFGKDVKILLCEFVNEDNTLIIIIQRPENKFGEIYYWNLFSTNDHFKYGGKVNFLKNEKNISSIARIPGKLITINDDGNIFSILDKLTDVCGPEVIGKELHSIVIQKNEVDKVGTPKKMSYSKAKTINNDKKHTVFHRKDSHGEETKPLVNNKEPWAMDNYKRISVYLDDEENIQLFIGRSTIQVWRNKSTGNETSNEMELEYIWANNVKADNEKDFQLEIIELYVGDRSFYAKVRWAELKHDKFFEIKWPYSDNHVTPIKHACDTLEHLYYRRKNLVGHRKQREFESMKDRISYIIWRFIKNKPNIWRLMDMRYDIMAKIIIGGSHTLVKYILFGDGNEEDRNLHIPKLKRCYDEDEEKFTKEVIKEKEKKLDIKNLSDLQIAIRLCKGGLEFNRRSLIVAYLLEYYTSSRSLKHIGWLCTVSGALPDLYKYNLKNFAKEIFYKRCISGYEISNLIEYKDLLPKVVEVEVKASQEEFRAFSPNTTLISKGESRRPIRYYPTKYYANIFFNIENFSPTIKIVPLYNFTVCELHKRKNDMAQSTPSSPLSIIANFLLKVFRYLFIPRRYLTNNKEEPSKLSPLVQIVRNEEDDDILDNPAIEAAINYKWGPAKKYFLRLFFTYILFATCFAALAGCYLGHIEATGHLRDFLVFIFVLFYYSGIYLFSVEIIQFLHHSWRHYLDFFNFVDLASVVFSLVLISVYVTPTFKLSNAFADVASTSNISAGLSFIMLLLWFEFILYLRLFSEPAKYLYIVLNIIKKTYLFVVFMLLVVLALAHAFLLLLQHMEFHDLDDITPQTTSYTLRNNAGDTTGTAQQIFDRIQDNPSKDFGTSFLATYAWLRGSYPQETTWNSWAVEALTLIGSLFLITVIQNIFIAFIWAVYTEASEKGRVALLKFRAGLISDFEALNEIHFSSPAPEPKYIYSLGNPKSYDAWEKLVKEREGKKLYDDLEEKMNKTKLLFKEKDDENSLLIYEKDEKLVKEREKMKLYDLERIIDKIKEKDEKSVKEGEAKKLVYDLEGLMNEVKLSIKEKSDNNNDDSYSLRSEESIDEDYEYGDDGDYDDDDDDV